MSVNAPCGRIAGITRETHTAYLGIPYAQAPYPAGAFAAPQPRAPFTSCFEATAYGGPPPPPPPRRMPGRWPGRSEASHEPDISAAVRSARW
ncbi:carboxylesterase family protein [Streptomyces sp. 8L]|uniref:carboxylesterase family protein n=1 Tax=Streptomyces sp. 8L TaxID=2877242 RepID=UPI001CD6D3C6|nr:carboxylesterase family protein [Streptomyces sp. 8L]